MLATHPRCYERDQDVCEPQHYLALLEQRPGAFEHAKPIRQWRATWPAVYDELLGELQRRQPDGAGVRLCLHRLQSPDQPVPPLDLTQQPALAALSWSGVQATDLQRYEALLTQAVPG